MIDFAKLSAPFPADRVSWRVGSTTQDKSKGMALAYVDARDVQDRLDDVCGPENWQNRYPHANGKTVCEIGIRVGDEWIWKANGAGDTDHEAEKGALSDAFKRAAVMWGVAKYLYDVTSPWVRIEPRGKSYVIAEDEYPKLRALLEGKKAAPPPKAEPKASLPLQYPDGPGQPVDSVSAWLDLYEKAAEHYGHAAMWAENDGTISSIQAKAAKAGKQDIVNRITKLHTAAQGKAA